MSGERTRLGAGERVLAIADFVVSSKHLLRTKRKERLFRRDAETSTRDACALQAATRGLRSVPY
jgi:hypothetical protein